MNLIKTDLLTKGETNRLNNLLMDVATEARRRSRPLAQQEELDSLTIGAILGMIHNLYPETAKKLERFGDMSQIFNLFDRAVIREICSEFGHQIVKL